MQEVRCNAPYAGANQQVPRVRFYLLSLAAPLHTHQYIAQLAGNWNSRRPRTLQLTVIHALIKVIRDNQGGRR